MCEEPEVVMLPRWSTPDPYINVHVEIVVRSQLVPDGFGKKSLTKFSVALAPAYSM